MQVQGEVGVRGLNEIAARNASNLRGEGFLANCYAFPPFTIWYVKPLAICLGKRDVFDDGVAQDDVEFAITERQISLFANLNEAQPGGATLC